MRILLVDGIDDGPEKGAFSIEEGKKGLTISCILLPENYSRTPSLWKVVVVH
jgi:hypothetical protein